MRTVGLSPKLYGAVLTIVVGLVLVALGERDTGLAVVLSGVGGLGLGAVAGPGEVAPKRNVNRKAT